MFVYDQAVSCETPDWVSDTANAIMNKLDACSTSVQDAFSSSSYQPISVLTNDFKS